MAKERAERREDGDFSVPVKQETVEALKNAATMEEYLTIASQSGIDWDALPDEWLEAISDGDVTELIARIERRERLMRRHKRKEEHADRI